LKRHVSHYPNDGISLGGVQLEAERDQSGKQAIRVQNRAIDAVRARVLDLFPEASSHELDGLPDRAGSLQCQPTPWPDNPDENGFPP
jgi:hypothetical protein